MSHLVVLAPGQPGPTWRPVATFGAEVAAWIAQRSGVTMLRFNQQLVRLALHAGTGEPGGSGWTYGDRIGAHEIHRVIAAFNGGFKLIAQNLAYVGFLVDGRSGVPLKNELGSIVTYTDGMTAIGAWNADVPAPGRRVASVLQNLDLLVDHGRVAATADSCALACWGATLGGGTDVARSALGITADGQLVWAAGISLSPAGIGRALVDAGATSAVELDINPAWVAGYLYVHHPPSPSSLPVVPGQNGIVGHYLTPYRRDFFTVLARR